MTAATKNLGDHVEIRILRRTLVEIGTKRHFAATQQTVAIGGKADIGERLERHHAGKARCAGRPLLASNLINKAAGPSSLELIRLYRPQFLLACRKLTSKG